MLDHVMFARERRCAKRCPACYAETMPRWAIVVPSVLAVGAAGYAIYELADVPPRPAARSVAATESQPAPVPARSSGGRPPARAEAPVPTKRHPNPTKLDPGDTEAPREADDRPRLGDSRDPDRAANAQAVFDDVLAELASLKPSELARAQELFVKGIAALERVEDELAKDDELGHVRLRRDTDRLGAAVSAFTPSGR